MEARQGAQGPRQRQGVVEGRPTRSAAGPSPRRCADRRRGVPEPIRGSSTDLLRSARRHRRPRRRGRAAPDIPVRSWVARLGLGEHESDPSGTTRRTEPPRASAETSCRELYSLAATAVPATRASGLIDLPCARAALVNVRLRSSASFARSLGHRDPPERGPGRRSRARGGPHGMQLPVLSVTPSSVMSTVPHR
jgi:hypothetical protein